MYTHKKLQTSPYVIITTDGINKDKKFFSTLTGEYYDIEDTNLQILEYCRYPREIEELQQKFGEDTIEELIINKLLSDPSTVWQETNIVYMEMETCTYCNWKCEYCPITFDPKPHRVMGMDVYNEIIDKAARHPSLKHIAFNFFNEPTLDIFFEDRVRKLAQTHLKLILFTNGSMLDEGKIQLLKDTGVLDTVRFNVPSVNEAEFKRLTGSSLFRRTMANIENSIAAGFNVEILVNGTTEEVAKNMKEIEDKYRAFENVRILHYITMDRAGLLKNRYAMNYHHKDELCGCMQIIKELRVGYNGDFFICTMDYYQKDVFGNIKDGEIEDIMKSQKAQLIRKRVFGAETAPEDYICRRCWAIMLARLDSRHSKGIKPVFKEKGIGVKL